MNIFIKHDIYNALLKKIYLDLLSAVKAENLNRWRFGYFSALNQTATVIIIIDFQSGFFFLYLLGGIIPSPR